MGTPPNQYLQSGVIQVSTGAANGAKRNIPCICYGMQGKRLKLETTERLPVSTPVSIEYNDTLFLGEVFACRQEPAGGFQLDIQVEQILTGLQSLMGLRERLLGEGVPQSFSRQSCKAGDSL